MEKKIGSESSSIQHTYLLPSTQGYFPRWSGEKSAFVPKNPVSRLKLEEKFSKEGFAGDKKNVKSLANRAIAPSKQEEALSKEVPYNNSSYLNSTSEKGWNSPDSTSESVEDEK